MSGQKPKTTTIEYDPVLGAKIVEKNMFSICIDNIDLSTTTVPAWWLLHYINKGRGM